MKQTSLLKAESKSYGGELLKTRKGRSQGRPLDTRNSMHLVLRSSKAIGEYSFKKAKHSQKIQEIVDRFALKYGVRIISLANVGNHLHFHIKLTNRYGYYKFIRAVTSAIAMAVSGVNRWTKKVKSNDEVVFKKGSFWDYRPFTRVVIGFRAFLSLRDYVQVNQLEGFGIHRIKAHYYIENRERYTRRI